MLPPEVQAEVLARHFRSGESARKIAKELDIDRKSVSAIIKRRAVSLGVKAFERQSMLDQFEPRILTLLSEDPSLPATVIMQRLRECGYLGGYTILKDRLKKHRPRLASPKQEAFLMIDFLPGECAQVDWGEFDDPFGSGKKIHCFAMVLCYSRKLYIEFTRAEKFEDFIRCFEHGLLSFGGVPEEIWTDNLPSAVTERFGKLVKFNARFFAYAGHQGFRPHACNKGKGNEKGRVENLVKFVRTSFWPGRRYKDFNDICEQARIWNTDFANMREHKATRRIPELVWASEEKSKLAPLRPERYDTDEILSKEVPPNFHLAYETNLYSVPWTMVGQVVTIRISATHVRVLYNDRQVSCHERDYTKHGKFTKPEHEEGLLEIKPAAKDGRAWQVEALKSMGPELSQYVECLGASPRSLRYELSKMLALSTVYGSEALCKIVGSFLARGVIGADHIELALKNTCQTPTKPAPLTFKNEQLSRVHRKVDLRRYDALLFSKKGVDDAHSTEARDEEGGGAKES